MLNKRKFCFSIWLVFLLLLFGGSRNLRAQLRTESNETAAAAATPTPTEIELLRRRIDEQKLEIQKLQDELKEESELRKQQQKTLEALTEKLEKFDSTLAALTKTDAPKPVTVIPASLENSSQTTAATVQTKTPDSAAQTATSAKQPDKSNPVESGFGKVRFDGLIQGWYSAGNRIVPDTFRVRRAEMRFSGDLLPKVKWSIMFDMAKLLALNNTFTNNDGIPVLSSTGVNQSTRVFQEAYVTLGYFKRANIQIGQFKLPFSQEALQSTASLDTVERALFLSDRLRGGALGDVRDIGVMAFGALNKQFDYQVGVFNGSGESQNDVDRNEQKAVTGRLVFHPKAIKGLQIGTSGVWGGTTSLTNPRRDRFGAEIVYEHKPFKFKSEYMGGIDGDVHRRGFYAHFGYRFMPKLEAVFRYDMFDPDIRRENGVLTVTERDYIAGLNYFIKDNNLKLQINYFHKTFANGISPAREQLIVNLQTSW